MAKLFKRIITLALTVGMALATGIPVGAESPSAQNGTNTFSPTFVVDYIYDVTASETPAHPTRVLSMLQMRNLSFVPGAVSGQYFNYYTTDEINIDQQTTRINKDVYNSTMYSKIANGDFNAMRISVTFRATGTNLSQFIVYENGEYIYHEDMGGRGGDYTVKWYTALTTNNLRKNYDIVIAHTTSNGQLANTIIGGYIEFHQ